MTETNSSPETIYAKKPADLPRLALARQLIQEAGETPEAVHRAASDPLLDPFRSARRLPTLWWVDQLRSLIVLQRSGVLS